MFPCLTLVIFCLNLIQMIRTINGTRCYTCQTGPERIICSVATECTGKACYVIMDGKNNVAGCTADIDPLTRIVGCYNQSSTRKVCACYTNFCNTPIGTVSFVSLPFSPLTANISAPWDVGFNPDLTTTTSSPTILTTFPFISTVPSTTTIMTTTTKIPSSLPSTLTVFLATTTPSSIQTTTKNSSSKNTIFISSLFLITFLIEINKFY